MSRWITCNIYNLERFGTNKKGCYAIYHLGEIIYIGQSANLFNRLRGYCFYRTKNLKEYNLIQIKVRHACVWLFPISEIKFKLSYARGEENQIERESRLIKKISPRFNKAHAGHKKIIARIEKPPSAKEIKPLLKIGEVAQKMKVSIRTINHWIKYFNFPVIIISTKTKRFVEPDIDSWLLDAVKQWISGTLKNGRKS